jgi:hypothetical protein
MGESKAGQIADMVLTVEIADSTSVLREKKVVHRSEVLERRMNNFAFDELLGSHGFPVFNQHCKQIIEEVGSRCQNFDSRPVFRAHHHPILLSTQRRMNGVPFSLFLNDSDADASSRREQSGTLFDFDVPADKHLKFMGDCPLNR